MSDIQAVLGNVYRDSITGFTGTAVARTTWLTGCDRITLQPSVDKEGKVPDAITFDEPLLVLVKENQPKKEQTRRGGPRPEPVKR